MPVRGFSHADEVEEGVKPRFLFMRLRGLSACRATALRESARRGMHLRPAAASSSRLSHHRSLHFGGFK